MMRPFTSCGLGLAIVAACAAPALAQAAPATPAPAAAEAPAIAKVRGMLTGWYAFDADRPDAFFLRRANIWITGEPYKNLTYTIMFQPQKLVALPIISGSTDRAGVTTYAATSNADRAPLQDAFLTYKLSDMWTMSVGQFRPALSAEARNPAPRLPLANRALFLERNPFGFYRDRGLELASQLPANMKLTLGVYNGEGTNGLETNHQKDALARLDYVPLPNLQLGLAHLRGATTGATAPYKDRWDANFVYDLGPYQLSGELLAGTDGPTLRHGWYTQGAWRFAPALQAVARYELYDADRATPEDQRNATLGLNYFLGDQGTKFAINLIHEAYTGTAPRENYVGLALWQIIL
jgi:hypothetical protein